MEGIVRVHSVSSHAMSGGSICTLHIPKSAFSTGAVKADIPSSDLCTTHSPEPAFRTFGASKAPFADLAAYHKCSNRQETTTCCQLLQKQLVAGCNRVCLKLDCRQQPVR